MKIYTIQFHIISLFFSPGSSTIASGTCLHSISATKRSGGGPDACAVSVHVFITTSGRTLDWEGPWMCQTLWAFGLWMTLGIGRSGYGRYHQPFHESVNPLLFSNISAVALALPGAEAHSEMDLLRIVAWI